MFWKTLITTFGVLFLAELGDKTQLAVLCPGASGDVSLWAAHAGISWVVVDIPGAYAKSGQKPGPAEKKILHEMLTDLERAKMINTGGRCSLCNLLR